MPQTLKERRTDAKAKLEELRQKVAANVLDGGKINYAAVARTKEEIEALDNAGVEQVRRVREVEEQERRKFVCGYFAK